MTSPQGAPRFVFVRHRMGCWPTALAVLAGVVVIALALVFSMLFLAAFAVVAAALLVRAWWQRWRGKGQKSTVIEAEYQIVEYDRKPDDMRALEDDGKRPDDATRRTDRT